MNYKKLLCGLLVITSCLYISQSIAMQDLAEVNRELDDVEGKAGAGFKNEELDGNLNAPTTTSTQFQSTDSGLSSEAEHENEEEFQDALSGNEPLEAGGGAARDGSVSGTGGNDSIVAQVEDLEGMRVARGEDGRPSVTKGSQSEGAPRAENVPTATGRQLSKEEIEKINSDVDRMSDEDLLSFRAKDGEDSAELTKAQSAYTKARQEAEDSIKNADEAVAALQKAKATVEDTEAALKEAIDELKGFEDKDTVYFDKDGNFQYKNAIKRNEAIKARLKEMDAEHFIDPSAVESLEKESAAINKFLTKNKELKAAKLEEQRAIVAQDEALRRLNRAGMELRVAREALQNVIKKMSAARLAALSGATTSATTASAAPHEPTAEEQAANQRAADEAQRQQQLAQVKTQIEAADRQIEDLKEAQTEEREEVARLRSRVAELQNKKLTFHRNPEKQQEVQVEIDAAENELRSAQGRLRGINKELKSAEADRQKLITERDGLSKAEGEAGPESHERTTAIGDDLRKVWKKIAGGDGEKGVGTRMKEYWKSPDRNIPMDTLDATYNGVKWGARKLKQFTCFLWDQLKIGFAFMIPGDIVATIQAAYQAAAMYSMITAVQNFANINMYTVAGLIPSADATNGIFLYTDTSDSGAYTDPNRRFFMSYDSFGNIGTNYLGSGAVNYMIEFSTGMIFDNNGDALVYGYPAVPLKNVPNYTYSGTSGSNNTITTVIYEWLPNLRRDVSGGVKRETKVDGLLEGFRKVNATPAGNGTVESLLSAPRGSLPALFNSTIATFQQGVNAPRFGMTFKQVEGLGIVSYLLTHYKNIFDAESKGQLIKTDTDEMKLIELLGTPGTTVSDITTLATGSTYNLSEESFLGIKPGVQLLLGNVFIYQTDDTPIVGLMKNALPAALKPHVHDYVVGINSANVIVPVLIPKVNLPAGASVATAPVIAWGINPDVAYIISLVSGVTYGAGGVTVMTTTSAGASIPDYTLGNTMWGQVTATSGGGSAYGGIAGFNNQLNATQQHAQFMIDKGPFYLNGRYKAYRVTGLENLFDAAGMTDSQVQFAQNAVLLGMAANESGAKITSTDPIMIGDKKTEGFDFLEKELGDHF